MISTPAPPITNFLAWSDKLSLRSRSLTDLLRCRFRLLLAPRALGFAGLGRVAAKPVIEIAVEKPRQEQAVLMERLSDVLGKRIADTHGRSLGPVPAQQGSARRHYPARKPR